MPEGLTVSKTRVKLIKHQISYKKALKRGYIGSYDYNRCPYCGSTDLKTDRNQQSYSDDIAGHYTFVEGGIVCGECHNYQGYISYGCIEPAYIKEKRRRLWGLKKKIKV